MKTQLACGMGSTLLAVCITVAGLAAAQDFPNRPIRMIIPYGPGGITDVTARIIAPPMTEDLGQQVIVENRPGGGAVMDDLVAGHIAFVFSTLPTAHGYVSSGRLRALAVTGLKRNAAFPEVPAMAETLPGFNVNAWLGLFGPAGMPATVTDRLTAATAKALQRPETSKRLIAMGAEVAGSTPAQMGAYLKNEMDRWVKLAKEVKFELAD